MKTEEDRPTSLKKNDSVWINKSDTLDFVAPEAYHLKYPSEHGLDCVGLDTKSNLFSKFKVYVAVQRTPDQAQTAAANGRDMEKGLLGRTIDCTAWLYSRLLECCYAILYGLQHVAMGMIDLFFYLKVLYTTWCTAEYSSHTCTNRKKGLVNIDLPHAPLSTKAMIVNKLNLSHHLAVFGILTKNPLAYTLTMTSCHSFLFILGGFFPHET